MAFPWPSGLSALKDASLSKMLLLAARQYLKDIGEVLDVVLDTGSRSIDVEMLPLGEQEPIWVRVSGYGLEHDASGANWLTFEKLCASREWLTRAVARFLPGKRLPLPADVPLGLLQKVL